MRKLSGRRENRLGLWLVVILCASIVPGVVFAVPWHGNGNAGKVRDFIGLWQGVDPLDGSTVRVSLSNVDDDGILELTQAETFYSFCHSMGPEFSSGRGVEVGTATVGSSKDVLEVDIRLICIEDDNTRHEQPPVSVEYQLRSRDRNLLIPAFPNSLPIVLHRVAQ
jgi:hypothetical protein